MFVLKAEINNFFKKAIVEESTQDNSINKLVTMVRTPRFEYCRDEKSHYVSEILRYG